MNGNSNGGPHGISGLDLEALSKSVPILGKKIDEDAIKLAKVVLAKLEAGDLLNLAVVAEDTTGNLMMSYSSKLTSASRLRAGLATLGTHIDISFIQASAAVQAPAR